LKDERTGLWNKDVPFKETEGIKGRFFKKMLYFKHLRRGDFSTKEYVRFPQNF
jgi:hypothetical protein